MDEDGGDGPGGAIGEAEDCHPKHRWVRRKHTHAHNILIYCSGGSGCMSVSDEAWFQQDRCAAVCASGVFSFCDWICWSWQLEM